MTFKRKDTNTTFKLVRFDRENNQVILKRKGEELTVNHSTFKSEFTQQKQYDRHGILLMETNFAKEMGQ